MRILLLGDGAREHALAWVLLRAGAPSDHAVLCAPGSAGVEGLAGAQRAALDPTDLAAVVALARDWQPDLTIAGAEAPLALGVQDALAAAGFLALGPSRAAARLESSKAFARDIADAAGIPSPRWRAASSAAAARAMVADWPENDGEDDGLVIKADGLAAGKGVVVAEDKPQALAALERLSGAGHQAFVLEARLRGREASVFALSDGAAVLALGTARDYKRAYAGDKGPNTGGMGAVAPAPDFAHEAAVLATFMRPAVAEMAKRGMPYRGFLYAGVMETADGLKLIEFNARLGDPETQALAPLLAGDLAAAMRAAAAGDLASLPHALVPQLKPDVCALAVVLAAKGYPHAAQTPTRALPASLAAILNAQDAQGDTLAFVAKGTRDASGRIVPAAGRALTLTGLGTTYAAARERAYAAVRGINWQDGFCRDDIGLVPSLTSDTHHD